MYGHSVEKKNLKILPKVTCTCMNCIYTEFEPEIFLLKKETSDSTQHIIAHFHFKFKQWAVHVQYMHFFCIAHPSNIYNFKSI